MNTTVMQATDLTGASFSAALFGMVATSVLLLLGTGWVSRAWKLVIALCALSTVVGAMELFEARNAWLTAKAVPIVYHYAGWIISLPVLVLALFFFARRSGEVSQALFWRLSIVSLLMVLVRYLGDAGLMHATLGFLIGIILWLYILGELYFGQMDEAVVSGRDQSLQRGYFWLRLIVTIGWAIYPLGSFITSFGSYTDTGAFSLTYNIADFFNRIAFGLVVMSSAMVSDKEAPDA